MRALTIRTHLGGVCVAVLASLVTTPPAFAQVPVGAVTQVAPTREDLEGQLRPRPRAEPLPSEPLGLRDAGEGEAEKQAPPASDTSFSFTLRELEITNSTVYQDDDFREIYEPFLDTDITIGGLREIADRIEQLYRDDGYVATRVIVPPQAIEGGIARLEVYEGRIIHYEINGDIGPVKKQMARLLDNLLTGEPARWSTLERYLLLARDLPGISLTGTLQQAGDEVPGGVILIVDAARKPVEGFVRLHNRNGETTGPLAITGGLGLNSNTQWGERIGAVALTAIDIPENLGEVDDIVNKEQLSGFLSYEQSIGDEGLRVHLSALQSYSEPGAPLDDLNLVSNTTIVDLGFEYPMVRSRRFSLWTRGGFQYEHQWVDVGDPAARLQDDHLRIFYGGIHMIALPPLNGVTTFDVEIRQGLTAWGASVYPDFNSSEEFTLVRAEFSHRQPIPPFFELFVDVRAQRASDPLPPIEEMSLGELTIGRGFEPGALVGDNGIAVRGELRYYPPGLKTWWLQDFSAFAFYDYGLIDDYGNPTANPKGYEDLSSAGFGIRFQAFDTLFGELYYAEPLDRAIDSAEGVPSGSVKFTLTKFF